MGLCFCGLGSRTCNSNRSAAKKEADPDCGLKMAKFFKPRTFRTLEMKQEQANYNKITYNTMLTLEDLILSSPAFDDGGVHGGDHLHALKQCSSRRVHPSFDADTRREKVLHESKVSISAGMAMKAEEGGGGRVNSSTFHGGRSEKLKKKVSFRSPEVAEVFILEYSHEANAVE